MGLLGKIGGKIGDKINEKIDETLNPKMRSTSNNSNWKEEYSEKQSRKHGKEISELEKQMDKFYQNDSYVDLFGCCSDILGLNPCHLESRKLSVYALVELERYNDAHEFCSKLLEDYPNDSFLMEQMGKMLLGSGEYIRSITWFERLIQKTPASDSLAYNSKINKAIALTHSGNFEEAIQFCTDELRLEKNDKTLLMIKNKALEEIQNVKEQKKIKEEKIIQEKIEQESPQNNSGSSIADQISKFNKLKEQGAITEEEFSEMKKKLMDKI